MSKGYVSMRNEDGTQWAEVAFGTIQWAESKAEATLLDKTVFEAMLASQEQSRKNDCPDNGFFGVYNLKFHEKK